MKYISLTIFMVEIVIVISTLAKMKPAYHTKNPKDSEVFLDAMIVFINTCAAIAWMILFIKSF